MTTKSASAQGLTISDLSERTGLTPATLRAWETRHGFPSPSRRASGHRRYAEHDVVLVQEVLRRRDAGVRLEVAIADAAATRTVVVSPATSVFAELRRAHPYIAPQRLRKSTLLALTWAMEDECCARAETPWLFGAFQEARFFRQAEARWRDLGRTARTAVAFADFGPVGPDPVGASGSVAEVHLPAEAPMRREWSLVCHAPGHSAALAAWELPGQDGVPDAQRRFESVWTVDPAAVRDAARVCARLAEALAPGSVGDAEELDEPLVGEPGPDDLRAATELFQRLLVYVDGVR